MKRVLILAPLVLAGILGFSTGAQAGHGHPRFDFGFGYGGGHAHVNVNHGHGYFGGSYRACAPVRHVHCRVPVYTQVWVPPLYHTVIVGYDHCRRPIYREVLVRNGYYRRDICSYRCNSCGVTLY